MFLIVHMCHAIFESHLHETKYPSFNSNLTGHSILSGSYTWEPEWAHDGRLYLQGLCYKRENQSLGDHWFAFIVNGSKAVLQEEILCHSLTLLLVKKQTKPNKIGKWTG